MNYKSTKNNVIVKLIHQEDKITESGIYFKNTYRRREDMKVILSEGEVLNIGQGIEDIKIGDIIFFNPFDAYEIDKNLFVVKYSGIELKIDN